MKFLIVLSAVLSCVAAAQTLDGINAPVTRTVTLTADEAAFAISAAASLDATQQQVKEALENAGLPNPTVVATGLAGAGQMLYSATVTIPAASAIDTAKSLEVLRAHLTAPLQGFQYSVSFNPSQAAVEAMRKVVLPQMMDDARKLGQSLAAATGVKLGAIRSISDSAGVVGAVSGSFSAIIALDPGKGGGAGNFLLGVPYLAPSNPQFTYSLNVVFAAVQ
jgi:hypothetical protein